MDGAADAIQGCGVERIRIQRVIHALPWTAEETTKNQMSSTYRRRTEERLRCDDGYEIVFSM